MSERLAELREMQDDITAQRRDALIGSTVSVLVDTPGVGRSHREAPEIDGVIHLDRELVPGSIVDVEIVDALGPDLVAAGVSVDALEASL
jgi:ribosomal protein S12 methylthiotransferase